jgi:hypothetical protein
LLAGPVEAILNRLGGTPENGRNLLHRQALVFKKDQGCPPVEGQRRYRSLHGFNPFMANGLLRSMLTGL